MKHKQWIKHKPIASRYEARNYWQRHLVGKNFSSAASEKFMKSYRQIQDIVDRERRGTPIDLSKENLTPSQRDIMSVYLEGRADSRKAAQSNAEARAEQEASKAEAKRIFKEAKETAKEAQKNIDREAKEAMAKLNEEPEDKEQKEPILPKEIKEEIAKVEKEQKIQLKQLERRQEHKDQVKDELIKLGLSNPTNDDEKNKAYWNDVINKVEEKETDIMVKAIPTRGKSLNKIREMAERLIVFEEKSDYKPEEYIKSFIDAGYTKEAAEDVLLQSGDIIFNVRPNKAPQVYEGVEGKPKGFKISHDNIMDVYNDLIIRKPGLKQYNPVKVIAKLKKDMRETGASGAELYDHFTMDKPMEEALEGEKESLEELKE